MGKQILLIQGGGRPNGNTAQLVRHFVRGPEDAGHSVEVISLLKQEVKGCLGCNACRYGKPCVQKDTFNDLVPKIKAADCIVFASPLYFWTLSSMLKAFIERLMSLEKRCMKVNSFYVMQKQHCPLYPEAPVTSRTHGKLVRCLGRKGIPVHPPLIP